MLRAQRLVDSYPFDGQSVTWRVHGSVDHRRLDGFISFGKPIVDSLSVTVHDFGLSVELSLRIEIAKSHDGVFTQKVQ
jgi:hypothetical protein